MKWIKLVAAILGGGNSVRSRLCCNHMAPPRRLSSTAVGIHCVGRTNVWPAQWSTSPVAHYIRRT